MSVDDELLDQAEDYFRMYLADRPDVEAHGLLRSLIDGARTGEIPNDVASAAADFRDRHPNSTLSLMIQKIVTGGSGKLTPDSLMRWIAATNAEKKPPTK